MSDQKVFHYPDHKPVTRRQFLGLGMGQAASFLFLPDILSLMGRGWLTPNALGAGCDTPLSDLHPFLVFDLIGGASLAGNFVVGKKGGPEDFLKSYNTTGVPKNPSAGEPIDKTFGAPMFTNLSKMREGLKAVLSADTQTRLRMATICNSSQDDTGENQLSPAILVSRAGFAGKYFKSGLSQLNTDSGGNSKSPVFDAPLKPVSIQSVDDVIGSLSYGPALSVFSEEQKLALGKALSRLSDSQLGKLQSMQKGEQFRQLASCGYLKNIDYARPVSGLDPRQDPSANALFDLAGGEGAIGAIVFNALQKNSGPGVISIFGCDYHDGTQTSGDNKDLEVGRIIGKSVELAAKMGKPLFFAIVSDGSVYSDEGTRVWRGDAGSKGLAVMGYYHPTQVPQMRRTQIGSFTDGQAVDRSTYIGNDPRRVAYAIAANYLSANGKIGDFEKLISISDFELAEVDNHLAFG